VGNQRDQFLTKDDLQPIFYAARQETEPEISARSARVSLLADSSTLANCRVALGMDGRGAVLIKAYPV
jgi:hypothetical protein